MPVLVRAYDSTCFLHMLILFISLALCMFLFSSEEQEVDYDRLSIARQVHNFHPDQRIEGLRRNVALLNYTQELYLNEPVTFCPQCEKKRYTELQNNYTELLRRYHKLNNKYNELGKRLRDEQTSPPPLPKLKKLGLKGDDALCVVCMVKKRQFILRPCKHYCVCNDCKNSLKNKCPVCRTHIQKYEKLFVS